MNCDIKKELIISELTKIQVMTLLNNPISGTRTISV